MYPHGYNMGSFEGDDKPAQVVVKDKACRPGDANPFPCDSWLVGGPAAGLLLTVDSLTA